MWNSSAKDYPVELKKKFEYSNCESNRNNRKHFPASSETEP